MPLRTEPCATRAGTAVALAVALVLSACGDGAQENPDAGPWDAFDADGGPADAAPSDAGGEAADRDPGRCTPECPEASCGDDDGCGGTCSPCPTDVSCEACPLTLRVVERDDPVLKLALDFAPEEGDPLPELADLRLVVEGDATMLGLELGEPVLEAGKSPLKDPDTGEPWQILGGSTIRVSLASTEQTEPIGGGRWLVYTLRLGGAFDPITEPVVLHLSTAEAVFAPPGADAVLWGAPVEDPVVLWPR
ncbi:MAG: hypothetical protein ACQEXJ_13595 [Myxococcota bacterium]